MEDPHFTEKKNCNATAFALRNFSAKAAEECFDVLPGDVRAGWMREDRFQCSLMRTLHGCMVPRDSTERNSCVFPD